MNSIYRNKCQLFTNTEIDDCISNLCASGSTCIDGTETYSCDCQEGHTGLLCDQS